MSTPLRVIQKNEVRWQDEPQDDDDDDGKDGNMSVNSADSLLSEESVEADEEHDDLEDEHEKIKKSILSKKDLKAVWRLRCGVTIVLLGTASAVCALIYSITATGDDEDFEAQYRTNAVKVVQSFEAVLTKITIISQLAIAVTAEGIQQQNNWPFITLSAFQERARAAMDSSQALYVSINPLVTVDHLEQWEEFVLDGQQNHWIAEGHALQQELGIDDLEDDEAVARTWGYQNRTEVVAPMHTFTATGSPILSSGLYPAPDLMLPRWQTSPVLYANWVNEDLFHRKDGGELAQECFDKQAVIVGRFHMVPPGTINSSNLETAFFATLRSMNSGAPVYHHGDPMAHAVFPIFDSLSSTNTNTSTSTKQMVAMIAATFRWKFFFQEVLSGYDSVTLVLHNDCDGAFTYEIHGPSVRLVGQGDYHNTELDHFLYEARLENTVLKDGTVEGLGFNQDNCPYSIRVYPTDDYKESFESYNPAILTMTIAATFAVLMVLFGVYDRIVDHRQKQVLHKATKSTALVASLFPKQIRDQLLGEATGGGAGNFKGFENRDPNAPIADLYPHCTVFFCDIAGFTAWSSTREPAEVFELLQTLYGAFDEIAKKRKVFKVETIGDSYVAVTGLPEAQPLHAILMAKFASDCIERMNRVVGVLRKKLGPDTSELGMRVGMHSGPVTAGVLKGDRARFQLFGDTVNTAARMESNGAKNKIQVSYSTYDELVKQGKEHWLTPRDDLVQAKGKGAMQTYWLVIPDKSSRGGSTTQSSSVRSANSGQIPGSVMVGDDDDICCQHGEKEKNISPAEEAEKESRLVEWIVKTLKEELQKLAFTRKQVKATTFKAKHPYRRQSSIEEVSEVLVLSKVPAPNVDVGMDVGQEVVSELTEYVQAIANMYNDNAFHCFEHACHTTMAASKYLKRLVAPRGHEYIQRIKSDRLTTLAILFSTLIHDADHRGVSNNRLIEEDEQIAAKYGNKSPAEQNSLDTAFELLMDDEKFHALKECLFHSNQDLQHFRQVLVNSIVATDIFDAELQKLRKERWEKAFSSSKEYRSSGEDLDDLRSSVIIEHIMQASDISHTMQHWNVYRKWNSKLFEEVYSAYIAGRSEQDPSRFWYQGEIGFFDNYVIPLAKKLKESNVFGVSSDECLNWALKNRDEFQACGEEIVSEMIQEVKSKFPSSGPSISTKDITEMMTTESASSCLEGSDHKHKTVFELDV
ncbi:Receptor-type guanylate cyclase gcy [Seminavis robusta]|uniref:Receptor-type guanylate cyclase gcy n=1 Tax=Seminavis robusta TaxID=568900 RepID=A0A9N8DFE4_9STRA|nr:Receptor-type guanylate cyclase gcy [Seminavis robusta]|eukprot:Sro92_g048190.1 Receptor-type guanylate cyclase gcy (1205) ;mRNA; f:84184-89189